MKQLLITIAAVVLVGCGPPPPDISIREAASKGNIEAVKQHLAAGTDVDEKGGMLGYTPLQEASIKGHKEVAELLIAKGANVNGKNDFGVTPLHYAADYGHREIIELLIAKGANVNAHMTGGSTPLDRAEEVDEDDSPEDIAGKKEAADLLRKHGGKNSLPAELILKQLGKSKKEQEAAGN